MNGKSTVEIVKTMIIEDEVDAITNAANGHLAHGGGVAGAIRAAGGKGFQAESNKYIDENGEIATGGACFTSAGGKDTKLKCKNVIHCVGPVYKKSKHDWCCLTLHVAILNTLETAKKIKAESVSIPAISSGIFGFPR